MDFPEIRPPWQRRTFGTYLAGDTDPVPKTEERYQLRVPQSTYRALERFRHEKNQESLTACASRALYFGYHDYKHGTDIDWDAYDDWYAEKLVEAAEYFEWSGDRVSGLDLSDQPQLKRVLYVRPKGRHLPHMETMKRLFVVPEIADVYRICIWNAILCYDWTVFGGDALTQWTMWPMKVRAQIEHIIEDRKERIGDV